MTQHYQIEANIPIPKDLKVIGRNKYPLELLEPGQSFFVPIESPKQAKNLRSSMGVRAKKLGIKIVTMADDTGVRVWRTM
jgi:hypothetical protein